VCMECAAYMGVKFVNVNIPASVLRPMMYVAYQILIRRATFEKIYKTGYKSHRNKDLYWYDITHN
jgi:hypothetical protein